MVLGLQMTPIHPKGEYAQLIFLSTLLVIEKTGFLLSSKKIQLYSWSSFLEHLQETHGIRNSQVGFSQVLDSLFPRFKSYYEMISWNVSNLRRVTQGSYFH